MLYPVKYAEILNPPKCYGALLFLTAELPSISGANFNFFFHLIENVGNANKFNNCDSVK